MTSRKKYINFNGHQLGTAPSCVGALKQKPTPLDLCLCALTLVALSLMFVTGCPYSTINTCFLVLFFLISQQLYPTDFWNWMDSRRIVTNTSFSRVGCLFQGPLESSGKGGLPVYLDNVNKL